MGCLLYAILMLPYAHYAYSRADGVHLAFGILPFLTGVLVIAAILSPWPRYALTGALCLGSVWAAAALRRRLVVGHGA